MQSIYRRFKKVTGHFKVAPFVAMIAILFVVSSCTMIRGVDGKSSNTDQSVTYQGAVSMLLDVFIPNAAADTITTYDPTTFQGPDINGAPLDPITNQCPNNLKASDLSGAGYTAYASFLVDGATVCTTLLDANNNYSFHFGVSPDTSYSGSVISITAQIGRTALLQNAQVKAMPDVIAQPKMQPMQQAGVKGLIAQVASGVTRTLVLGRAGASDSSALPVPANGAVTMAADPVADFNAPYKTLALTNPQLSSVMSNVSPSDIISFVESQIDSQNGLTDGTTAASIAADGVDTNNLNAVITDLYSSSTQDLASTVQSILSPSQGIATDPITFITNVKPALASDPTIQTSIATSLTSGLSTAQTIPQMITALQGADAQMGLGSRNSNLIANVIPSAIPSNDTSLATGISAAASTALSQLDSMIQAAIASADATKVAAADLACQNFQNSDNNIDLPKSLMIDMSTLSALDSSLNSSSGGTAIAGGLPSGGVGTIPLGPPPLAAPAPSGGGNLVNAMK